MVEISGSTLKGCSICQQYKPDNTKPSGLLQSTHFSAVEEMMGINIMGPFPWSWKVNCNLIVFVNYYSKWTEIFPVWDSWMPKLVRILSEEIFTHWGTPKVLLFNRGSQFMSQLLKDICKTWGVVRCLTMNYYLQTNLRKSTRPSRGWLHLMWVNIMRLGTSGCKSSGSPLVPPTKLTQGSLQPLAYLAPLDQLLDQTPPLTSAKQALLDRLKDLSSSW